MAAASTRVRGAPAGASAKLSRRARAFGHLGDTERSLAACENGGHPLGPRKGCPHEPHMLRFLAVAVRPGAFAGAKPGPNQKSARCRVPSAEEQTADDRQETGEEVHRNLPLGERHPRTGNGPRRAPSSRSLASGRCRRPKEGCDASQADCRKLGLGVRNGLRNSSRQMRGRRRSAAPSPTVLSIPFLRQASSPVRRLRRRLLRTREGESLLLSFVDDDRFEGPDRDGDRKTPIRPWGLSICGVAVIWWLLSFVVSFDRCLFTTREAAETANGLEPPPSSGMTRRETACRHDRQARAGAGAWRDGCSGATRRS